MGPWLLGILRATGRQFLRIPRPAGLVLVILWAWVIWRVSAVEGQDRPPNFLKNWLSNSAHAPLFGFLAFLGLVSFPREGDWPRVTAKSATGLVLLVLVYGRVDEWHQSLVAGRHFSYLDVMTDGVGAAVTLWIAAYLGRSDATGRGLSLRLAGGLCACLFSGYLATLG